MIGWNLSSLKSPLSQIRRCCSQFEFSSFKLITSLNYNHKWRSFVRHWVKPSCWLAGCCSGGAQATVTAEDRRRPWISLATRKGFDAELLQHMTWFDIKSNKKRFRLWLAKTNGVILSQERQEKYFVPVVYGEWCQCIYAAITKVLSAH